MMAIDQVEISKIIGDLLRIAKVAMPPKLYAEDPRIAVAAGLLARISAAAPTARVPTDPRPAGVRTSTLDVRPVELSAAGLSARIPSKHSGDRNSGETVKGDR